VYDNWGKLISIDGSLKDSVGAKNPYRYRGYRYDTETGLYYLNSRYYNPEFGRFINADGIIGQTGELLGHNLFTYSKNNPVNMSDDNGFRPVYSCNGDETPEQYQASNERMSGATSSEILKKYGDKVSYDFIGTARDVMVNVTENFPVTVRIRYLGNFPIKTSLADLGMFGGVFKGFGVFTTYLSIRDNHLKYMRGEALIMDGIDGVTLLAGIAAGGAVASAGLVPIVITGAAVGTGAWLLKKGTHKIYQEYILN
jgi:RHS repeat-associated protein